MNADEQEKPNVATSQGQTSKRITKKKTARKKKSKKKVKKKTITPSTAPWNFPKNSLEDALLVAKSLEAKFAGNPTKAEDLVKAVGYNKVNDWRFLDLLKSSAFYGLTSGSGTTATIIMEELGEDIVAPDLPQKRKRALLGAFRKVDLFQKVEEYYKGKKIPEDEFFENTLIRHFKVPRDRVKTFSKVFLDNLTYLKAFRASSEQQEEEHTAIQTKTIIEGEEKEGHQVREFLDTCFVMMPFGEWFDQYYKQIYIPAIREAGLEPVRADELFSTGSVVEQIWEQIEKSKVLLADLSGKNPNVFYELGLAHAARKPVVFTTGSIEDVPFDLRHLRVIPYEIREPGWDKKLHNNITSYLKNAKEDPNKSIPQPFRDIEPK